jgi:ribosomal protein S27AE
VTQLPCPRCGNVLEFLIAPPKVFNMDAVSTLIIEHPEQVMCSKCNENYTVGLAKLEGLQFAPMPIEPRSKIVKPSNGKLLFPPN